MSKFIKIVFIDTGDYNEDNFISIYSGIESTDWQEVSESQLEFLRRNCGLYTYKTSSTNMVIIERSSDTVTDILNIIEANYNIKQEERRKHIEKLNQKKIKNEKKKKDREKDERELFEKLKIKFDQN